MFSKDVENILNSFNTRFSSTNQLLQAWLSFIEQCAEGYEMNIYEYDNDLSVRNIIQKLLDSVQLQKYPEFMVFAENVASADVKFKSLLSKTQSRNDKTEWWQRGILNSAGDEYMSDIKSQYP